MRCRNAHSSELRGGIGAKKKVFGIGIVSDCAESIAGRWN